MARPSRAIVDLDALRHNYQVAELCAPESQNLAVVKANAYGHGALAVARALEPFAPAMGVACIEEALELRAGGIKCPILLLEGPFGADEIVTATEHNFWLVLENASQIQWLIDAKIKRPLRVWLKLDTGMHRLGLPAQQAGACYALLAASSNVSEVIMATHFSCADDPASPATADQMVSFIHACQGIPAPRSMANSAGLLAWPEASAEWNRPGIMLYGISPFAAAQPWADSLRPVMTLKSAVISLRHIAEGEAVGYGGRWVAGRPSTIATVAIGYGDGYPRQAPDGTPVLVNGQRAGIAGTVSMDMIGVDVTDLSDVRPGAEVILWGSDLPVNDIAARVGTIGYELLTRMPARTPRSYR